MNSVEQKQLAALSDEALEFGVAVKPLYENLQHWRCHEDNHGVQWWLLDQQGGGANTLSQAVLRELQVLVDGAEAISPPAVVIRSAKTSGFIAGADIDEFRGLRDPEVILALLVEGHTLFNQLENLSCPSIAIMHGFCLGGGLELALACRYRIARNDTMLGFPEVLLGLHPGLGGTMRLPRLIDPPQAMEMMLTGKSVPAKRALKMGLVDACGEERHFAKVVTQVVSGTLPRRGQSKKTQLMSRTPVNRVIAHFAEKQARKQISEKHYPAPFALLDYWQKNSGNPDDLLAAERRSFADLLSGDTAQNLVRVFFLREALKAQGKVDHAIRHVHVIGAGTMGGDIAAWCASRGFKVTVEDRAAEYIAPAIKRAHTLFARKLHSETDRRAARDNLIPDLARAGRSKADLIIEAAPEVLELKQEILAEVERVAKKDAIIATNTSSIKLESIREGLNTPARFVGVHFFNPVAQMQLVEIVTHDQLDSAVQQRAQAFATAIDRLPIAVKSAPGFLVNRVLTPYLMEALVLIDEGHKKEAIDRAGEDFGFPMGPVELADFIGLDICLHVAETLQSGLEQPMAEIPGWFKEMVERGDLGRKSGKGFYNYGKNGKAEKSKEEFTVDKTVQDRLILPVLNTCVLCRQENIVEDNDLLDGAVIFATGFAPFTGGPLHYAKTRGVAEIVETLKLFSELYGERFTPAEAWHEVIENHKE